MLLSNCANSFPLKHCHFYFTTPKVNSVCKEEVGQISVKHRVVNTCNNASRKTRHLVDQW